MPDFLQNRPRTPRNNPEAPSLTLALAPKTRNPAFGGVSSFRIRLPATGADLLQGGRAPSRFSCTWGNVKLGGLPEQAVLFFLPRQSQYHHNILI
jgi:hypothetical protein